MGEFKSQAAFEIGLRLDVRGDDSFTWIVVSGTDLKDDDALEGFTMDLGLTTERAVAVVNAEALSAEELVGLLQKAPEEITVLTGLDDRDESFWSALDINRSGLVRPGALLLWLAPQGINNLCSFAPNIRSFVGGSMIALQPDGSAFSQTERADRIRELENHYGKTSSDLVRDIEGGGSPEEPQIIEWLILLGRGDLA